MGDEYRTNEGQVTKDAISPLVVTPFGSLPLAFPMLEGVLSLLEEGQIPVAVSLRGEGRTDPVVVSLQIEEAKTR